MLTIRKEQMAAIRRGRRDSFVEELRAHVERFFPGDARVLGEAQLRTVLELGLDRAALHGIRQKGQTAQYVSLMFMLGSFFDEDPQLPWAAAALGPEEAPAGPRLEALQQHVKAHLREVAGPKGDRYRRALARVRRTPFEAYFADGLRDLTVRSIARRLYPEKLGRLGDLRPLIALAEETAARHGLPVSGDGALCGPALMLLLGAHFDRDPIHPWAAEVLETDLPPREKAEALHRQALGRIDLYFPGKEP